jgi:hypothetical protein
MKEIEKAVMNEIISLRLQGLSDKQIKLILEQHILKGMINATALCQNQNNEE